MKRVGSLLLCFVLLFASPKKANADIIDDILNILTSLTCETQGIGDLLRTEFSHTCIPAPFFTFLIANIVSPGVYANTMLRLKINDNDLFPGACQRVNRIDYNDQKLSFALCNNVKLAAMRIVGIAESIVYIAKAMFTGQSPWNDIVQIWTGHKADYHTMFLDKREGDWGVMVDIGIIPLVPWQVIKDNDRMCVATISITGWIPVGCKYIKEPYPQSIYSKFMDLNPDSDTSPGQDALQLTTCFNGGGCYQKAYEASKTGIVMTGPLIECVKQMAARLMVSTEVCTFSDINLVLNTASRETSAFFQFQKNMQQAVAALLTIYVILFGAKILLTGDSPPQAELINFVIKFIFVIYFSIGINVHPFSGDATDKLDGIVEWLMPLFLGAIDSVASWVLNAAPTNLCKFNSTEYPTEVSYISLWDALDCRVAHYLGLDFLQTMYVENMSREHDFANFDFFNFSIPPYYYLLVPAALTGNLTLVSLALMYPLLVISVGAYLLNSVVVCIIAIVILAMLAPLFVPMLLFEYTKQYFDSWLKLMISFVLQPMIVVTFMITMFTVYDYGFYGYCKYKEADITSAGRMTKVFYIDNDWSNYTKDEMNSCQNSLGYMLNNPLAAAFNIAKDSVEAMKNGSPNQGDQPASNYTSQFSFLDSLNEQHGPIASVVKLIYEKIKAMILALITACFTLYLMYHFSAQLSEFAADLSGGVGLGNTAIKAQTMFKAGMSAMATARAMRGMKGVPGAGKARAGASDKIGGGSGGGGGASDKVSSSSGGASDSISTGSGGSGVDNTKALVIAAPQKPDKPIDQAGGQTSAQASEKPKEYVPMKALSTSEVKSNTDNYFQSKGIDSSKLEGFSGNEFARYGAFASDQNKFEKIKSPYEAMLEQTLKSSHPENQKLAANRAEFRKQIESMYSGTQKEQISEIHDRVFGKETRPTDSNTGSGAITSRTDTVKQATSIEAASNTKQASPQTGGNTEVKAIEPAGGSQGSGSTGSNNSNKAENAKPDLKQAAKESSAQAEANKQTGSGGSDKGGTGRRDTVTGAGKVDSTTNTNQSAGEKGTGSNQPPQKPSTNSDSSKPSTDSSNASTEQGSNNEKK
jgi:type IV secretion system protein VirB6